MLISIYPVVMPDGGRRWTFAIDGEGSGVLYGSAADAAQAARYTAMALTMEQRPGQDDLDADAYAEIEG